MKGKMGSTSVNRGRKHMGEELQDLGTSHIRMWKRSQGRRPLAKGHRA
jgi:hypothetical protein